MKSLAIIPVILFSCLYSAAQKKAKPPTEKDMVAYLMVYHKDETHSIHFAISRDGYTFTEVNNGKAAIAGDTIAEQKGIRDPYIMRAPDGTVYMVMTDLHIYAKQAGFRTTEFERERDTYGWGNNKGIVVMKSKDLVHWQHHVLRVDQAFPGLTEIGCAWAPELIYDDRLEQIMIYFSMRFGNGKEKVYYSYMNKDFSKLTTFPKPIFEHPKQRVYIDADITKVGNKYHMFYASHDGRAGIRRAISDSISSGYVYDSTWIDFETKNCEAPTIFKRIGQNKWVLVYDVYGIQPHNFGFCETSDFVHFENLGHFNEGVMKAANFSSPKHPGIIQITKQESETIARHWHLDLASLPSK